MDLLPGYVELANTILAGNVELSIKEKEDVIQVFVNPKVP